MMSPPALMTWEALKAVLPHDLCALAKNSGAVRRWRKITSGEQLLWMCLVYAQVRLSLRATAGLSVAFGGVTEGAVKHRLLRAGPFLAAVLAHVLNASIARTGVSRAIRLVDSTSLSVPGSVGTDWRIHACYVPGQGFTKVDITDRYGSECVDRAEFNSTDICLGDQGYGRPRDLHHIDSCGAHSVIRVYLKNIKLLVDGDNRLMIDEALDRADAGDTRTSVYVPYLGKQPLKARLIIRPLPPDKAQAARKKLRRRASKQCRSVTPQALRLAGYFAVLTTVSDQCLSDDEVVELYRLRWQIELLFKRWKSLLNLDKIDADDPALVRTFCLSKLIEAALLERQAHEALEAYECSCPDDNDERPGCTLWRVTIVYHTAFRTAVLTAFPLSHEHMLRVVDVMREGKRRRKNASAKFETVMRRIGQYAPAKEAA
jgi:hypothetical protein